MAAKLGFDASRHTPLRKPSAASARPIHHADSPVTKRSRGGEPPFVRAAIIAVVAGGVASSDRTQRLGDLVAGQPISNLFPSLAVAMGVQNVERFGDPSGRFHNI